MAAEKCICGHTTRTHGDYSDKSCYASRCPCSKWVSEPSAPVAIASRLPGGASVVTNYICAICLSATEQAGSHNLTSVPPGWSAFALGPANQSGKLLERKDVSWSLLCKICRAKIDELLGVEVAPKRRAFQEL